MDFDKIIEFYLESETIFTWTVCWKCNDIFESQRQPNEFGCRLVDFFIEKPTGKAQSNDGNQHQRPDVWPNGYIINIFQKKAAH